MPSKHPGAELLSHVTARARDCCEYCLSQRRFSPSPFSAEHILPRAKGGKAESSNLALACQGCNNHKYSHVTAMDPASGHEVPLYNPRLGVWSEHFAWSSDLTAIIGLTGRGRASVLRLKLNRPEIVALRHILATAGMHPPDYPYATTNP